MHREIAQTMILVSCFEFNNSFVVEALESVALLVLFIVFDQMSGTNKASATSSSSLSARSGFSRRLHAVDAAAPHLKVLDWCEMCSSGASRFVSLQVCPPSWSSEPFVCLGALCGFTIRCFSKEELSPPGY